MPLLMSASKYFDTWHLEPLLRRHPDSSGLINDLTIPGLWDRFSTGVSGLQPGLLGSQNLLQGLFWCVAKRRTRLKVRDVRNIPFVVFTVKHVDMIILHGSSSMWRL
jgi:hypothetical protein